MFQLVLYLKDSHDQTKQFGFFLNYHKLPGTTAFWTTDCYDDLYKI